MLSEQLEKQATLDWNHKTPCVNCSLVSFSLVVKAGSQHKMTQQFKKLEAWNKVWGVCVFVCMRERQSVGTEE